MPTRCARSLAGISLVAFSSPSGVAAFRELYGERLPAHLEIVALGELTARAARDAYPHHAGARAQRMTRSSSARSTYSPTPCRTGSVTACRTARRTIQTSSVKG